MEHMNSNQQAFVDLALFVGILLIYFLPELIALKRRHRNATAIGALNLLLGWTFVGWVGALVWALTDNVVTPESKKPNIPAKTKEEDK